MDVGLTSVSERTGPGEETHRDAAPSASEWQLQVGRLKAFLIYKAHLLADKLCFVSLFVYFFEKAVTTCTTCAISFVAK